MVANTRKLDFKRTRARCTYVHQNTQKERELDAENSVRPADCWGGTINPLMNGEAAVPRPPEALISRRTHLSFSLTHRETRHDDI